MLVAQDYVMRKKGVGGGVEAADHQPLGLKGQIGVLCKALQLFRSGTCSLSSSVLVMNSHGYLKNKGSIFRSASSSRTR